MNDKPLPVPFPVSRYVYYGDFRFYYGYGNTPPDDYLENISGIMEPTILILGCGDLRSCLYTLWKNFGTINSKRFNGVHFVLNDNSAAVLARNILFLYLCLKTPKEKQQKREWLCAVWAIWFCHELLPKHEAVLNNALSSLIKFASNIKAWSSRDNPLHSLVKFTSAQVLSEINQVWKMWHGKNVSGVKSTEDMNSARLAEQSLRFKNAQIGDHKEVALGLVVTAVGPMSPDISNEVQSHMVEEITSYIKFGSTFAEEIINRSDLVSTETAVNYTLFEREDGRYTLHYASLPYYCFYHSFQYSEKQLRKIKAHQQCFEYLLIPDSCFETHPLLANSMQQFGLWFQICSEAFNGPKVSFTVHCSDAIDFCQVLQSPLHIEDLDVVNEFDLIYTSNLFDHLAPPNVVLSALPLLKPSGYLFTLTLLYKSVSPTAEEYIQACFGFESKLLPILFGIRCINHEGSNYSSTVSVQPRSVEIGNVGFTNQWPKLLVWEKVNMHPQKVSTLVHGSVVTAALFHSIDVCAKPILTCMNGCTTLSHLCLETAIKMLQMYAQTLDADVSSYQFWSPLCDQLLQEQTIKPFFNALQTQCILHNLHLHLTVSDRTCPICRGIPLPEYIHCCSLSIKLPLESTPSFMAFVHKTKFDRAEQLHVQILCGMLDIHIFDNITGDVEGDILTLKFYCPQSLVSDNCYNVTLVSYTVIHIMGKEMNFPRVLSHVKLAECCTPKITHSFQKTSSAPLMVASQFGSVLSHSGDGDNFETVLHLSDSTLKAGSDFSVEKLSSSKVKILCGNFQHDIHYPHPVEYNRLAVKFSRKKRNVTILASRTAHNFEEESNLFLVDPVNKLSLPPVRVGSTAYTTACGLQFTKKDREIMERCHAEMTLMPPMVCLKQTVNTLFQCRDKIFFHISVPDNYWHLRGLVAIQSYLYDIQHKTPAIDLVFCFMEESFPGKFHLMNTWGVLSSSNSRGIPVTEGEYELLAKVLTYFAKRTVCDLKDSECEGTYKRLTEQQIDRYFTRAVVYPLYADPDTYAIDNDLTKPFTDESQTSSDHPQEPSTTEQSTGTSCSCCGSQSSELKKCSSCGQVQYCSRECQRKHWKEHKPNCSYKTKEATTPLREREKQRGTFDKRKFLSLRYHSYSLTNSCSCECHSFTIIMISTPGSSTLQTPFPIARYVYNGDRLFYYGYGNTPPDNYLENASGNTEPRILLLGCGDIRSCLYTLWKNFDCPSNANQYAGVHFVLNDRSAAVLARNTLFLYLCLKTPKEKQQKREWLCAVWAIWFCHELLPKHEAVLNNALSSLINLSSDIKAWSSRDNPLHSLVKFTSAHVLGEINQVWKMWHNKDVHGVKSVDDMNSARKAEQVRTYIKKDIDSGITAACLVSIFTGTIKASELSMELRSRMASEVTSYFHTGSAFVESTLHDSAELSEDTVVNYTLYERKDGVYTLHYASMPFKCFYHSFQFTSKQLKEIKVPERILDLLIMKDSYFKTHPLLANSAQQFALWFQSCAKVLCQGSSPNITFTVHCSDAIEFCQVLQSASHLHTLQVENQFDLIYTSNLIDYLSPANLVLSAVSLLKPSGYLFTLTLLYKCIGSTAEEYIHACFGFESKLLPILFGIRCINHEGEMYSSVVSVQLIPWELGNTGLSEQWPKLLIWEKVVMHPQKVPALCSDSNITTALYSSVRLCTAPLLCPIQRHRYIDTVNSLCVETVIKILHSSVAVFDADVSRHQFWSSLCQLILQEDVVKPFLHSLQTQCLLHDFHVHLTLTDATCPICSSIPVDEHISQISLAVSLPLESQLSPHFVAFLHKSDLNDAYYLRSQALQGEDVHIFDCFDGIKEGNSLILTFYCPCSFVGEKYDVTLVSYTIKRMQGSQHEFNAPIVLDHKNLSSCLVSNTISHYFQKTEVVTPHHIDSPLCSVSSHTGDGDNFETVLQFRDAALSKFVSGAQITTKQISSTEIEILCGRLKHKLCYPHPIEYDRLSLKISRKQKTITVLASRAAHNFEEENAFFQVNPANCLTLPPVFVGQTAVMKFSSMQFTKHDQEIMKACCREPSLMPPMVNLKETIDTLFKCSHEHFFHIVLPVGGVHAMMIIQNHVFDYQNKTPAIDLAFCFLEFSFGNKVCNAWKRLVAVPTVRDIRVNNAEYEVLRKVFRYFSKRTKCQQITYAKGRLQLLVKHGISQHFTRAVIYPLYTDPDSFHLTAKDVFQSGLERSQASNSSTESAVSPNKSCSYCGIQKTELKKCGKCGRVKYCSKECQVKHWKEHKRSCKTPNATASTAASSSGSHGRSEPIPSTSPIEEATVHLEKCNFCHIPSKDLKKCANCGQVRYCSRECQKKHWKEHKTDCHKRGK